MAKPGQTPPSYQPPNFGDFQQQFQDWRTQHPFPTQGQNPFPIPQTGSIPHPHPNMGDWQQKIQDWQGHWNMPHPMPPTPAPAPAPAPAPMPFPGNGNHFGWNHNWHNPEGQGWNHPPAGAPQAPHAPWNYNPGQHPLSGAGGPNVFHPTNPGASG